MEKKIWVEVREFPQLENGKTVAIIGSLTDITERKKATKELAKHRDNLEELVKSRTEELESSQKSLKKLLEDVNKINNDLRKTNIELDSTNKELESFSYSVSHDLRAPLIRLSGFSQALLDEYSSKLDDQGKHFINRIQSSSKFMSRLIDDMLSLSRISKRDILRQNIDLTKMSHSVLKDLCKQYPNLIVEIKIEKELGVYADQKFLKIFLKNLLDNALKYSEKKEKAIIEIGKKNIDNDEFFYIKDNGVGFNMKYYHKIFVAFQRLHHEDDFSGSGIGLAIVQRIVNKHGGKIWAESEEEKGSIFYFKLN